MGLTPVEIFLYLLLGFSALLLFLMLAWNFVRFSRRKVHQWQLQFRRTPDEFLALQVNNSRLKAEHAMMATRLEQVVECARMRVAAKEAEASRAINRAGKLAEDLADARHTIATHERTILSLENMLQEVRQKLAETQQRARQLFAERSELTLTLEERTRAFEKTSRELKLYKQQLRALEEELNKLRQRHEKRKLQLKALFKERQDLHEQVMALRQELEDSKRQVKQLERQIMEERADFIREKLNYQERINRLTVMLSEKEAKLVASRTAQARHTAHHKERVSA